jgi:AcrR family transcriptional regulator
VTSDESTAGADSRTRILAAAWQVFAAKGFWGGTLNEAARPGGPAPTAP